MRSQIPKLVRYLISIPGGLVLLFSILVLRPLVEIRLFVIPLRMTIVGEAERIRSLRETNRKRFVVLAYDEDSRFVNQALAHHLGAYAGWRRWPRSLLVATRVLAEKLGFLRHIEIRSLGAPHDDVFWHKTYEYQPALSQSERERAEQGLTALGITQSTKAIAILTRDGAFFKSFSANEEWLRRHEYRNCQIKNYSQAIEFAHQQGFRSVRVGRMSDNHLDTEPDGYVDYSSSPVASDLMDLVLAARCEFIVTCSSGLDGLYWLCGKPLVGVNLPWLDGKFSNHFLCLPKRMFVEEFGRLTELPLIAVTSPSFVPPLSTNQFNVPHWNGTPIVYQENSAAEILETMQQALAMRADPRLVEARRALVAPLWAEFNDRTPSSNLGADSRVRIPAMPMPDSVIARFLEVQGDNSR